MKKERKILQLKKEKNFSVGGMARSGGMSFYLVNQGIHQLANKDDIITIEPKNELK